MKERKTLYTNIKNWLKKKYKGKNIVGVQPMPTPFIMGEPDEEKQKRENLELILGKKIKPKKDGIFTLRYKYTKNLPFHNDKGEYLGP